MAIKCDICKSTDIIKQDGVFVCQNCGAIYSIEQMEKQVSQEKLNEATGYVNNLVKRMFFLLEERKWNKANNISDRVLDLDAENGSAYLGKLMIDLHVGNISEMSKVKIDFSDNINYSRFVRFGEKKIVLQVNKYLENIKETRQKTAEIHKMNKDKLINRIKKAAPISFLCIFIVTFFICLIICVIVPSIRYNEAVSLYNAGMYDEALEIFESLGHWRDSDSITNELTIYLQNRNHITYKDMEIQFPKSKDYTIKVKDDKIYLTGKGIPTINEFLSYIQPPTNTSFFAVDNFATSNGNVSFKVNNYYPEEDALFFGYGYASYAVFVNSYGVVVRKPVDTNPPFYKNIEFLSGSKGTSIIGQYRDKSTQQSTTVTITVIVNNQY